MSMSDPIADMLVSIKNAQMVNKISVRIQSSKIKKSIADVLNNEGYIAGCSEESDGNKKYLKIDLKYYQGKPVIEYIKRVSKPGLRIYKTCKELPKVNGGLGISIVSTSKGVITDKQAKRLGQGGEVICLVA